MSPPQPNRRITLIIIIAAIVASIGVYAVLVYGIHPVRNVNSQLPVWLPQILGVFAVLDFLVGIALEAYLLGKATGPDQVQVAAIVSCAVGESIAILGLVLYFLTGDTGRFTPFLIGSAAYFLALSLRLPRFLSRLED